MKRVPAIMLVAVIGLFFSCNTTRIVNSWKDPDTHLSKGQFKKIFIAALLKDETSRRVAEDKLVSMVKVDAVASYKYLPENVTNWKEEEIKEQLISDGFDAAVTMRLLDVNKEVSYTPGTITTYPIYYRSFGGYWVRSWNYYSTPDRYHTTQYYSIETNLYSLKDDKLIWSGLTETTDPNGVEKLVSEVARAVYKKMEKEGFIEK